LYRYEIPWRLLWRKRQIRKPEVLMKVGLSDPSDLEKEKRILKRIELGAIRWLARI
jgi:hypothetical protein